MTRGIWTSRLAVLLFLILWADSWGGDTLSRFGVRAGLGYDYISQEYFLDSLRFSGEDSSVTAALLTSDYLDDKKGFIFLEFDNRSLREKELDYNFEIGWEQTASVYRAIGQGFFALGKESDRLESEFSFETKQRYSGKAALGEELNRLQGSLKYRRKFSPDLQTHFKLYGENIAFDSTGTYLYNYSRLGARAGLDILTDNLNSIYFNVAYEHRLVPDSNDLNFNLVRSTLGFAGNLGSGQLSAESSFEFKDYQFPENRDDYYLGSARIDYDYPLGGKYSLITGLNTEYFNYRFDDFIGSDHLLIRLEMLLERESGDMNQVAVRVGPVAEILKINSPYDESDDYVEFAGKMGVDIMGLAGLLILLENQTGYRAYRVDPFYTSDFAFDRLTVIGSLGLIKPLTLDIFFSAEWEWHRIQSDDNRIYLIAASLACAF